MDKTMTEREAFDAAYPEHGAVLRMREEGSPAVDHLEAMIPRRMWQVWQVACKWQRERDAEICKGEQVDADATGEPDDYAYNAACFDCKSAILNQGSKE